MKKLPKEIIILKRIKGKLDKLMSDSHTPLEIRSNTLYDYISKDADLAKRFPSNVDFNRFIRRQHNLGIMKQIIPNYRVDTTNEKFYQWHFQKEITPIENQSGKQTLAFGSKLKYQEQGKKIITSDGKKVRSTHEKSIYEALLKCNYLSIFYDYPITIFGETKYVDFYIINNDSNKTYYWEHFGMTSNEEYMASVPAKIEWYKYIGLDTIDNGGNLIYTVYSDEKVFQRDISNYVKLIVGKLQTSSHELIDRYSNPVQGNLHKVNLFSDGGAEPNPGKGGYGIILTYKNYTKEFYQGFNLTTNNRMELMGIIVGLEKLKVRADVTIYTDSKYVINGIEKKWALTWKENNWYRGKKKAMNSDLWSKLLELLEKHKVKFEWVKGHSGHKENERCDQLASLAMKQNNLLEDNEFIEADLNNEKKKIIKVGDNCGKCHTPVIQKTPKERNFKIGQTYYFEYYLYCPNCKTIYMVEEAKRELKNKNLFDE